MSIKFSELIQSETPVLVDFFADWCGPCKVLAPVLKEVKDKMGDRIRIVKIDVDKNGMIAQQYRVQGVPTLILFQSGEMVWRESGARSAGQLIQEISRFIPE